MASSCEVFITSQAVTEDKELITGDQEGAKKIG